MQPQYSLINLKSFGDLTIAAGALKLLHDHDLQNIDLCIGSHHLDLVEALNLAFRVKVVYLGYPGVPAFYDVRDRGIFDAMRSLWDASKAVKPILSKEQTFLFDAITWREKILMGNHQSMNLINNNNNIYANYKSFFLNLFGRVKEKKTHHGPGNTVLIFPYARKNFRNIPGYLIDQISERCIAKGLDPVMYVLYGDEPIACKIPRVIIAKRSFVDLRLAIEGSFAVVSSDSFSAHLAAYVDRPVFVVSPYHKSHYWLPPHTLDNHYWGLFSESKEMLLALDRFLFDMQQSC